MTISLRRLAEVAQNDITRLWMMRLGRMPLLALGILSLLTGIWGGLLRLPVVLPLPAPAANWITFHGPLMVCGFLGTVIGLERAVGLRRTWTYLAPVLTGAGSLTIILGGLGRPPIVLVTLGSLVFVLVSFQVVRLQREMHTILMSLAGLAWLVGNALWWGGWDFAGIVPWWIAFLGLTILGERLELTRYRPAPRAARMLLFGLIGMLGVGVGAAGWMPTIGLRLVGLGLLGIALWLTRFDIAWLNLRRPGLPRFMAICLFGGYGWLAVSGAFFLIYAPQTTGYKYDAGLHAFFLGFVFMMIFGHAPLIFPSVLQFPPLEMRARFYAHVILLHAALFLRLAGDAAEWPAGRRWGAILSAVAVAVFLVNTVSSMALARSGRSIPQKAI